MNISVSTFDVSFFGKVMVKPQNISARTKFIVFLSCITFLVYANTLNNEFAYDDISVITRNTIVTKGIPAIPEILTSPYRRGFFITTNDLYRPLSQVMFAVEYQLFDGVPAPMHLINILFFIGCVIVLFNFTDAFFNRGRTDVAFITALLFALHPIHTEVVANIKGRDELLCFFFSMLSLNQFIKYTKTGKLSSFIAGILCLLLSLFSRETAVPFIGVILLVVFFYKNDSRLRSLYITVASVLVATAFLVVRFSVLSAYNAHHFLEVNQIDNALVAAPSLSSRLATAILLLGKYIKLLFIPYPLISDYSHSALPFATISNVWFLISLLTYTALIVVGVFRLIKYPKDPVAFGILFFLITIAIVSNIPFLIGATMGERFLFFASAGFCLLVALAIERIGGGPFFTRKKSVITGLFLLSVTYSVIIFQRNAEWKNSVTLYTADVMKAPDNGRLHFLLGSEMLIVSTEQDGDAAVQKQVVNEAIYNLRKTLVIYPYYTEALKVLGKSYYAISQFDSAAVCLNKTVMLNPDDTEALNNLNVVYFTARQYPQAIEISKRILMKHSLFMEGYNNIAICYLHLEQPDSAVFYLHQAIARVPDFANSYANLALAYKIKGNADSFKKYELIAQQYYPGFKVN